jgi:hypothetical protein
MIVCPLCEHAQVAAIECEVCGRTLAGAGGPVPGVPRLEGLEPTLYDPAPPLPGTLPELEPTARAAAPVTAGVAAAAAFEPLQLEATRAAPIDVDAPPLADVERTGFELPADGPTALPAFPICRYCRTPAMPGERICSRCGMRLPVLVPAGAPEASAGRVCGCGALVRGGACPACGARG